MKLHGGVLLSMFLLTSLSSQAMEQETKQTNAKKMHLDEQNTMKYTAAKSELFAKLRPQLGTLIEIAELLWDENKPVITTQDVYVAVLASIVRHPATNESVWLATKNGWFALLHNIHPDKQENITLNGESATQRAIRAVKAGVIAQVLLTVKRT